MSTGQQSLLDILQTQNRFWSRPFSVSPYLYAPNARGDQGMSLSQVSQQEPINTIQTDKTILCLLLPFCLFACFQLFREDLNQIQIHYISLQGHLS